MYKLKWTRLQNEIFRYLCIKSGVNSNQRDIAKALKVSPTAIAKSLKEMEIEKLIIYIKDKKMNLSSIELNREDKFALEMKRVENLKMIYESGLLDLLETKFPGTLIILFGSYSYGTDTHDSDIDIAVIGAKNTEIETEEFDKKLERKIIVQLYDSLAKIHKNLRDNLLNGIVLKGVVEL